MSRVTLVFIDEHNEEFPSKKIFVKKLKFKKKKLLISIFKWLKKVYTMSAINHKKYSFRYNSTFDNFFFRFDIPETFMKKSVQNFMLSKSACQ